MHSDDTLVARFARRNEIRAMENVQTEWQELQRQEVGLKTMMTWGVAGRTFKAPVVYVWLSVPVVLKDHKLIFPTDLRQALQQPEGVLRDASLPIVHQPGIDTDAHPRTLPTRLLLLAHTR